MKKDVETGNAVAATATDYYPFGMPMPGPNNIAGAEKYRYAYQGQEKDPETGKEAFELRLWDSRIGRWLTTDPARQYNSPYLGMGNNSIRMIDPDGGMAGCTDDPPCIQLETVVLIVPSHKLPLKYKDKYPNFYKLINEQIPNLLNDDYFAKVLSEFSGYSIDELKNRIFKPNSGPELEISLIGAGEGFYPRTDDPNADPNLIKIDKEFLDKFEKEYDNTTLGGIKSILEVAITVAHEDVHFGVHHNGIVFADPVINSEPGDAFERQLIRVRQQVGGRANNSPIHFNKYVKDNIKFFKSVFR